MAEQELSAESRRVTKQGGWEVPGLTQSRVVQSRRALAADSAESMRVHRTDLQPVVEEEQEFVISDNYFSANERKTLRLTDGPQAVMKVSLYDVGERVFCYRVSIHPKGVGAVTALAYYDEDGDGKFEIVEPASSLPSFVPRIPLWVR